MWYILMPASSLVFSSKLSSPCTVLSSTNSHVLNAVRHVENIRKLSCQPTSSQHITSYYKRRQLMWYILMSVSSLVFSSKLSSLCMVWSTSNSHVLNVVRMSKTNKKSLVNQHHHITSTPIKKCQLMWYILMSASSLVFSSKLSSPCTVSSTTKPHEQK